MGQKQRNETNISFRAYFTEMLKDYRGVGNKGIYGGMRYFDVYTELQIPQAKN